MGRPYGEIVLILILQVVSHRKVFDASSQTQRSCVVPLPQLGKAIKAYILQQK